MPGAGGTSPIDAAREFRAAEAAYAEAWFRRSRPRCSADARPRLLAGLSPAPAMGDAGSCPTASSAMPSRIRSPGEPGDPRAGRAIVADRRVGLCLLCHAGPFPEERFQGDLAPDLAGVGNRLSAGQLRLRLVDSRRLDPETIMPSYYRVDGLARVGGVAGQARPVGRADRGRRGVPRDPARSSAQQAGP